MARLREEYDSDLFLYILTVGGTNTRYYKGGNYWFTTPLEAYKENVRSYRIAISTYTRDCQGLRIARAGLERNLVFVAALDPTSCLLSKKGEP